MVDRPWEPTCKGSVVHDYGADRHRLDSLHGEFESIRRLLELHRQTVMVAIISSQLVALSIVLIIALAMRS